MGKEDVNFNTQYNSLNKYEGDIIAEIVKDSNIPKITTA